MHESRSCLGEVLEVGVLEVGRVFEAVAEEAIEGYVGRPDECDGGCSLPVFEVLMKRRARGRLRVWARL